MEEYDYRKAMCEDIRTYIEDNNIEVNNDNREEIEEQLNEDLWTVDSVTGNASGSYTFSSWVAEENLCHNLDLLAEACEEFGADYSKCLSCAETADVTIRCYLLGECIGMVLDEMCDNND